MTDNRDFYDCDHPGCFSKMAGGCVYIDYRARERKMKAAEERKKLEEKETVLNLREENLKLREQVARYIARFGKPINEK